MKRIPVRPRKSKAVRAIGYDPKAKILELELTSGAVYQYLQFPKDVYDEFVRSDALGKFLHERIKGVYQYKRMHVEGCSEWYQIEDCHPNCRCWCHRVEPKDIKKCKV